MNREALELLDHDTLIRLVLAQAEAIERVNEIVARVAVFEAENAALRARVAELEAKLGLPPKTPDNSSTPPSQGRKASDEAASKPKGKPHAGAHRPLHPNPTARRDRECQIFCVSGLCDRFSMASARPPHHAIRSRAGRSI